MRVLKGLCMLDQGARSGTFSELETLRTLAMLLLLLIMGQVLASDFPLTEGTLGPR